MIEQVICLCGRYMSIRSQKIVAAAALSLIPFALSAPQSYAQPTQQQYNIYAPLIFTPVCESDGGPIRNGSFECGMAGWNASAYATATSDLPNGISPTSGKKVASLVVKQDGGARIWQNITIPSNATELVYSRWVYSGMGIFYIGLFPTDGSAGDEVIDWIVQTDKWEEHRIDIQKFAGKEINLTIMASMERISPPSIYIDDIHIVTK